MGKVTIKRSLEAAVELPDGSGAHAFAGNLSIWSNIEGAKQLALVLRALADDFESLAEAEEKRIGAK